MRLEELERAEKVRLEELVKEQALKEKELQLKFDLERFKIESGFRAIIFLPVEILNAVQTRSQVKAAREERGIDSGDAKKGEDEVIIVSSDAEDEILIPALQEYVPESALLRATRENLINAQKNSEEIKPLYEQAASQVQVTNQVYSLEKELLVKNREDKLGNVVKLIVVPEGSRDPIKSLCHEGTSAHLGITKSKDKLNRYFYWPNCYRDMEQFVKTCDQCQRAGKPNDKKKAPLKLVPVIQEVFTKLNIDACGPLPITSKGNRYLIMAICMSSKFPEAIQVSDISSVSITDAQLKIFSRNWFPVKYNVTRSNHVERFHRTLKRLLRVLCLDAGSEWDKHLPSILLALRTVSHESTGYTPSELVYGKNLRAPETLVMEHWMEPEEEGWGFSPSVSYIQSKKLAVQWIDPGIILNKISETNYLVEIPGRRETSQIYHINMVKPYYKRSEHVNVIINDETQNSLADQELEIPYLENNSLVYDFEDVIQASELNKHLHDKQMDLLRELLNKYSKCFLNNPGLTNLVEQEIQLVSDQPVRTRPYRMSHRQNEILKNEINRMLKLGIIEIGESDYMSPMILVEVAGKEPRPCIDYRKLNGIIRTEYFPLPNIEERVEKVSAAKFITVLDLSKGYWQIPLSKTAQRYAAFCTTFGTYRPLRMSFGLKNALYIFSKLMAELLNGLEDFVVPYLDDIAIFSDTWESHLKHVETGFRAPSEVKVQAVLEFPTPRTKTQIRAFLGLAGYYQKYINLLSVIAAPLTDALKGRAKKGEITWTTECENAFRELKGKLIDKPVLYAPNFEREFIVQTDASNTGMGAVLTQLNEQGSSEGLARPMAEDASELSTRLGDGKCREGTRSVAGEELSPLVGQLVSHWEDGSLGRKGAVGREKKYSHANGIRNLKVWRNI
ncbi:retrovirus-related Pol polyprotein from transposon 297 [Trichonephila clavipes]|nr:retrovirus-related Pol polyprotein from transposon 297 [Trichonephila clavipes]